MTAAEQYDANARIAYLRDLEKSLAFERASGVIGGECVPVAEGEEEDAWFDLDSTEMDLSQEAEYLESRNLLKRHPEHPNWVMIADDEDEPFQPEDPMPVDSYKELT